MELSKIVNGHDVQVGRGLTIVVIGAGIGGLSAATLLAKQGHEVIVCESSRFATELGAAIHIPPNAGGLLKRMGISASAIGANPCLRITSYTAGAHKLNSIDNSGSAGLWQHQWTLGHRVRLHNSLKEAALKHGATLRLATPIVSMDTHGGNVTTNDGSVIHADVIVGADGVHSVSRGQIASPDHKPFGSGKSAFRFMIPRQSVLDDPQTRPYAECDGELVMVYHKDRRLVMYPTNDNTLLNLVCIHPEDETASTSSGDWNNNAAKEMLLQVYDEFHEDFKAILNKVDESSLKIWRLLDMEVLQSWTSGRLALLGDAAHPFLPHQGQGGAVAMEDATALGVVLKRGLRPEEVPDRLALYQQIRKSRADRLQQYTRLAGEDLKSGETAKLNMMEYIGYNFGHDEYDNSTQKLREWKWSKRPQAHSRTLGTFGPMSIPSQGVNSVPMSDIQPTFITASIKIKTSRTVLQNLFPPGSTVWKFKSLGSVAYCTFSQTTLNGLEWLGGQGYHSVALYVHGVEYTSSNGSTTAGAYLPVIFENLADSVISEREVSGIPAMFSDIEVERAEGSYSVKAGWRGNIWGTFELSDLRPAHDDTIESTVASVDAAEAVLLHTPSSSAGDGCANQAGVKDDTTGSADRPTKAQVSRVWTAEKAAFTLDAKDWRSLPTLHHVIDRLAEIPVYEIVTAQVIEGTGIPDVHGQGRF